MSIKRIYNVKDIFYLSTRGFRFFVENDVYVGIDVVDRKINLVANGKTLAVQLKGVESLSCCNGVHKHALILATLNDHEKELLTFLSMSKENNHLENIENVYLEIEFGST